MPSWKVRHANVPAVVRYLERSRKAKRLKNLGRDTYRTFIEPYTPRQLAIRRIFSRAKQNMLFQPKYANAPSYTDMRRWWIRYHRAGQQEYSPANIQRMLMMKPTFNRKGGFVSGYGLTPKQAKEYAKRIANPKGIPKEYKPKKPYERGIEFTAERTYHVPYTEEYTKIPAMTLTTKRPGTKYSTNYPSRLVVGRTPTMYGSMKMFRRKTGRFTAKQQKRWDRMLGNTRLKLGDVKSGNVTNVSYTPRLRVSAINQAKEELYSKDIPRLKRIGLYGAGGLGGYGYYKHKQKETRKSTNSSNLIKSIISGSNRNLLRGILLSGLALAGVSGLSAILRSGQSHGIRVPSTQRILISDNKDTIHDKIDNIVDNSNVTNSSVNSMIDTLQDIKNNKSSTGRSLSMLSPEKRAEIQRKRNNLLAYRKAYNRFKQQSRLDDIFSRYDVDDDDDYVDSGAPYDKDEDNA